MPCGFTDSLTRLRLDMSLVVASSVLVILGATCAPSNPSTMNAEAIIVATHSEPALIIAAEAKGHAVASDLLANLSRDSLGAYRVSRHLYFKLRDEVGFAVVGEENSTRLARWKEQFEHWSNIDTFTASIRNIGDDHVMDEEEHARLCVMLPQWESHMRAAVHYVEDYRKVEPRTVEDNHGLVNLQVEAERGLVLLGSADCTGLAGSAIEPALSTNRPLSDITADIPRSADRSLPTAAPPAPVTTTEPTNAPAEVPQSITLGDIHRGHWYEAADRCDEARIAEWSDEIWEDTALAYVGAAILVGIAETDWSLSPMDLQSYREFLNGSREFAAGEWSGLFDMHKKFSDTLANATNIRSSGALMVTDYFRPDFPHFWLAQYHDVVPSLRDRTFSDGRFKGTITVLQGQTADPLRDSLSLFQNQFYCRTTELQM